MEDLQADHVDLSGRQVAMVDITQAQTGIAESLICITCTNQRRRAQKDDYGEVYYCHPDQVRVTRKVTDQGRTIPLKESGAKLVLGSDGKRHIERPTTVALAESCGWNPRALCLSCERFRPVEISTAETTPWGARRRKSYAVTGSCSLPEEGIIVDGRLTHCDFRPKPYNVIPSCLNCEHNVFPTENTEHTGLAVRDNIVIRSDLDTWEMVEARKTPEPGYAIWNARQDLFQSDLSRYRHYEAEVVERRGVNLIHLRFLDNRHDVLFGLDNDGCTVVAYKHFRRYYEQNTVRRQGVSGRVITDHITIQPGQTEDRVMVYLKMDPWREAFDLDSGTRIRPRFIPHPRVTSGIAEGACKNCTKCQPGAACWRHVRLPGRNAYRSNWNGLVPGSRPCPRCSPDHACYVHARGLRWNPVSESYEFTALRRSENGMVLDRFERNPHPVEEAIYCLRVKDANGSFQVVDGNDNEPAIAVFKNRVRDLEAAAKKRYGAEAARQVRQQYWDQLDRCRLLPGQQFETNVSIPAIYHPTPDTTFVPQAREHVCVAWLNGEEGINFKDLLGWISMTETRLTGDFQHGALHQMEIDEANRAGNIGARLQEVIDATAKAGQLYDPITGAIRNPTEAEEFFAQVRRWKVIRYDLAGAPVDDTTWPNGYAQDADVEFFVEWLNEVEIINEVAVSNRQRFFGYEMSDLGSHSQSDYVKPEVYKFSELQEHRPEGVFLCPDCGSRFEASLVNVLNAECADCAAPLVFDTKHQEVANGERVGIGTAIHRDSERFMKTRQLGQLLCPNWQLRGSSYRTGRSQQPLTLRRWVERIGIPFDAPVKDDDAAAKMKAFGDSLKALIHGHGSFYFRSTRG
ncbi:MAG TPA: hypothetical protein VJ742_12950 [Nitrososphaera sp.]|nr:hypothetical protein [Nitrososphaera sp.]